MGLARVTPVSTGSPLAATPAEAGPSQYTVRSNASSLQIMDTFQPRGKEEKLASERFSVDPLLQAVARGEKELKPGDKGTAVKRLQLALIECGFKLPRHGADGKFSRELQVVVSDFQRNSGLPMTGKLDRATLLALDSAVRAIDHPPDPASQVKELDSKRFAGDPVYQAIAQGENVLVPGTKGDEIQKLQLTLMGLGYELPRFRADSDFGGETVTALQHFQADKGLPQTGYLDRETLLQLDDAAVAKVAELNGLAPAPAEKPFRYRVVADLVRCRAYVLEKGTDKPVASYLISPGTKKFPTLGEVFVLRSTIVRGWWLPPKSEWAQKESPIPPGLENPMGLTKLYLGQYDQFFHGVPKQEERMLGRPASHGCLRMSGANVLEFHQLYAGPGTRVTLIRGRAQSERLAASFVAAGITDRSLSAGQEYLAPYLYGEMGANEKLGRDGRVTVGGQGQGG